jgi:ABC-type transport system involved in resistance to organic solvents, periplasmic component
MNTQNQKFKIRLGLFIAGGLAIFIIAIFIIGKQKNLFDPVFKLTTTFYNVSGLQVGSNVRFSGINIGTVDNISIINDSTVRVEMLIKKSVQKFIKTDCEAGIGSAGIIGDRILILTQGSSDAPMIKDGQNIESKEPTETDAIMASLKVTADNAAIISDQLAEIMGKVNNGNGTLWKLIQDSTMANNISQTIVSLKKSSKGLDENMNAAKHNFLLRGFFKDKEKAAQKIKNDSLEKIAQEQKVIQKEEKKEEKAAQKVKDIATEKKADEQKVIQKEEKAEQKVKDKALEKKIDEQKVIQKEEKVQEDIEKKGEEQKENEKGKKQ